MKKYQILKKIDSIKRGRITIETHDIELPNKKKTQFYRHVSPNVAVIIPRLNKDIFIMVRQYRFGSDKISLEFPMGLVEKESPKEAAARELVEETGYKAKQLKIIGSFNISSARSTQIASVFIADSLIQDKQFLDLFEIIEIDWVKISDIDSLIQKGEISDATTLASLYLYKKACGEKAVNMR